MPPLRRRRAWLVERDWIGATDQAAGLRRLFGRRNARVIAFVASTAAGERSALLSTTATALAGAGRRVVVVDELGGDSGLVGAFGLKPQADLFDVLTGQRAIGEAVMMAGSNLRLASAVRAARELESGEVGLRQQLDAVLRTLCENADFVLIDASLRRSRLSQLTLAAPDMVLALNADSEAIKRAYALLKRSVRERGRDGYHLAVRHPGGERAARGVFDTIQAVARQHLDLGLGYLGHVSAARGALAEAFASHLPPLPGTCAIDPQVPLPAAFSALREPFQSVV